LSTSTSEDIAVLYTVSFLANGSELFHVLLDALCSKFPLFSNSSYFDLLEGALNLQGIEFARKGGRNCKEKNVQGKAPQFASV